MVVPARKLLQLPITNYANNNHRIKPETCNGLFILDFYFVVVSHAIRPFCSCQEQLIYGICKKYKRKHTVILLEAPFSRDCTFTDLSYSHFLMSAGISSSNILKDNFLTHVIHNSKALVSTHIPSSFTTFRNILIL